MRIAYFDINYKTELTIRIKGNIMGINTNSNMEASLQIGPTEKGMVRLFVSNSSIEIPMDFEPDEAREIADEILSAAKVAANLVDTKKN